MKNFLETIKEKINNKFDPEGILIIDNSNLHKKHSSFDINKLHLKIIIKSKKLKNIPTIEAHKMIFAILKNVHFMTKL